MNAIFTTFGIDWHLLLINAINFGLLLAGLTYFLYKPLTKKLEERRTVVAKGVEDAHAAARALSEIEGTRSEVLAKAGKEADLVLSQAQQNANKKGKEIVTQAEGNAARAMVEAQAQAEELKKQAIQESKEEVAKMIVLGIDKLARTSK